MKKRVLKTVLKSVYFLTGLGVALVAYYDFMDLGMSGLAKGGGGWWWLFMLIIFGGVPFIIAWLGYPFMPLMSKIFKFVLISYSLLVGSYYAISIVRSVNFPRLSDEGFDPWNWINVFLWYGLIAVPFLFIGQFWGNWFKKSPAGK